MLNHNHLAGSKLVAGVCAALLAVSLGACGGQDQSAQSTASESEASAQAEQDTTTETALDASVAKETTGKAMTPAAIGETGSEATVVKLTNGLDKDVTSFKMRIVGEEAWGDDLLKEGESIPGKKSVTLGFVTEDEAASFDILVKDADGAEVEVDGLGLSSMSELTLLAEDGVGYATYKDADGNEGTTQADGAQAGEVVAPQDSEAAPTSDGYDASETYDETTYSAPVVEENYSEPVVEETYSEPVVETIVDSAPEQSADDCTRDNIVLDI